VRGGVAGPNGKSLFKRWTLRALGLQVLHLPYFEWDRLLTSSAQDEYLSRRLAELASCGAGDLHASLPFLPVGNTSIVEDVRSSPPQTSRDDNDDDDGKEKWSTAVPRRQRRRGRASK
jgi:hypothetical protein